MIKTPQYKCPLCQTELLIQIGNYFHPNNPEYGLSLYCGNMECKIEVHGYTRTSNPAAAFEIIEDKYTAHLI